MRSWRVFGLLLAAALVAASLAPAQLASWADAHTDRPGGETLATAAHAWSDLLVPLNRPRTWLRDRTRAVLNRQF